MMDHRLAAGSWTSDPGRAPLPAGDPLAWGILVAGTSLDGTAWPGWGADDGDAPTRQGIAPLNGEVVQ